MKKLKIVIALGSASLAVALGVALPAPCPAEAAAQQARPADILLKGGTIYDGSHAPFIGDVVISGDRISYVGPRAPGAAARVIDAGGLVVAPGFIDTHTHIESMLTSPDAVSRLVLPFLTQGVTTAFIGVDGNGDPDVATTLRRNAPGVASAALPSGQATGLNYATYIGFGRLRNQVVGAMDRTPTPAELVQMQGLIAKSMCRGALGLSTGLFYAPQSYAKIGEVVALARMAARYGGIYDSHIRDESTYGLGLAAAIDEALTIGREAAMPVHIAHIKALGIDTQGQAPAIVARIEKARAAGQIVHADQYPWSASGTALSAVLVPRWAQDGGRAAMLARFDDVEEMKRMRPEMGENLRRRGGAATLLISDGPAGFQGRTLQEVAAARGVDPIDAAIAILRVRDSHVASFSQSEADIATFMRQAWVMTSSDASIGHPRMYGSFARKYAAYVKEKAVIDLRSFIERSSALAADAFDLKGRGHLEVGAFADVIVFDPARYAPRADYRHPTLFATGMRFVTVNGQLAIENGEPTGIAAGRPLPRTPRPGTCP